MEWETVILKVEDGVSTVVMNRPDQFNALDLKLGDDLIGALEACAKTEGVGAVVLTGAGKAFCSGGDLGMARQYLGTDPSEPYRQLTKRLNRIVTEIRSLDRPVVAAINGSVGGAGLSIAAACDLRIASSGARFRQAYTNVGLVPDGAWTLMVPLIIGFGRACELMFLDPVFDAKKALEVGLVNQVAEPGELEGAALQMARRLAGGPGKSFALAKSLLNSSLLALLERQMELERRAIIEAALTSDYREGLAAFFEKRPPRFGG